MTRPSKPQVAQAGMIVGATTQRPVEQTLFRFDRQIIDAGKAPLHEALWVEFPILVTVTAEPLAGIVAPFVGKANRNTVFGKSP